MQSQKKLFKKYEVSCKNLKEFCQKYYKSDRYTGRGSEYAKAILESHKEHLKEFGFTIISHHDNVTGKIVAYYK